MNLTSNYDHSRVINRRSIIAPLLVIAVLIMVCGGPLTLSKAHAQSFDGITIIELMDPQGRQAIAAGRGSASHIVTFVSGVGTYAALLSGNNRACVAWAREGSYTGTSISFGLARDEYEARIRNPSICYPFTLTYEDSGAVRVSAENLVPESLSPNAPVSVIRYSRSRNIVIDVPLLGIDWSHPVFSHHSIRNAQLGPILPDAPLDYQVSGLRTTTGIHKAVSARVGTQAGGRYPEIVNGRAMAAELTGWPWDVIYGLWLGQRLSPANTVSAFEGAIIERYGEPNLVDQQSGLWFWLYDLDGEPISRDDGVRDSCLNTIELWKGASIASRNSDMGPWGCKLLMSLDRKGSTSISSYRIEVASGYAMALNHFLARLEEIKGIQAQIKTIESAAPRL